MIARETTHTKVITLVSALTGIFVIAACSKVSVHSAPTTLLRHERRLRLFDPADLRAKTPAPNLSVSPDGLRLELVHISKTGGTAMIKAAWDQENVLWADCHAKAWQDIGCDRPDWPKSFTWMGPSDGGDVAQLYKGESWLAPPHWLHPDPYTNRDTFCVVRDPYDRLVSEYNDMVRTLHLVHDHREMNDWIQLKLKELIRMRHYPGHFLPQHFYVYNKDGRQVITHILRYEELTKQFPKLMDMYHLNIKLPAKVRMEGERRYLSKDYLLPDTITMINTLYAQDFESFNYTMVSNAEEFRDLDMTTDAEDFY